MRTRFAVLAVAVSALLTVTVPGVASAAPRHNHGLTINATPNPILAGEGVLIYGQLNGAGSAGQTIYLYHRLALQPRFTLVQRTTTNSFGFYEFVRADGVVTTNRNWYVRGPDSTRSRTVNERVAALVSLVASFVGSTPNAPVTGQTVLLSGHVTPNHAFEPVLVQEQNGLANNGWTTIRTAFTGGGSNFTVPYRWSRPGIYTLRAVFKGDTRNITGTSDDVTVDVTQKQNPLFTISSSSPIITDGQSVTISGVLSSAPSTPEASTQVTLYGMTAGGSFQAIGTTVTGAAGNYSFPESPTANTAYKVQTTLKPTGKPRPTTATLYEGVQDVVTISGSQYQTATVGETIMLTGTVTPDHTGDVIYLQSLGSDGDWHNVATGVLASGSTYSFPDTFGQAGVFQLRTRIYGDPENVGAASKSVTITVMGVAPASTLPPAS